MLLVITYNMIIYYIFIHVYVTYVKKAIKSQPYIIFYSTFCLFLHSVVFVLKDLNMP